MNRFNRFLANIFFWPIHSCRLPCVVSVVPFGTTFRVITACPRSRQGPALALAITKEELFLRARS